SMIVLFSAVIVATYTVAKEHALQTGTEIFLRTQPVDPQDLFRGDYVNLSYDISWFDAGQMRSSYVRHFALDETVYVTLDRSAEYVAIKQIHYHPPLGDVYLKGRVTDVHGDRVRVSYGIENYYRADQVRRHTDGAPDQKNIGVLAAVDRRGHAIIKKLLWDKQEVRFE
ncbi:MAG: GDYXXLXY domain-containing protein, partial [Candidatus Omnitrophica bacterium]|nr:GDYXXLXY domain-containing protein [Candidatus Omnitrophota bacterium]